MVPYEDHGAARDSHANRLEALGVAREKHAALDERMENLGRWMAVGRSGSSRSGQHQTPRVYV